MSRVSIGLLLLLCLLAAEAIQAARVNNLDSILRKDKKDKDKKDKGKDKGKDDKNAAPVKPANIKHVCKVLDPKKYTTFFALGDLHGTTDHVALLKNAGLINDNKEWVAKKTLLVITGDTVHGGPESAPVWKLVQSMISQAPKHGSEVVLIMGNHESDHAAKLQSDKDVAGAMKQFGADYPKVQVAMSKLPVCAVLGKIMFAHSGYIDAEWDKDDAKLANNVQKYWTELKDTIAAQKFGKLLKEKGPGSIVCRHDWVMDKKMFRHNRKALALMGFDMLIAGHEAKLFGKDMKIGNAIAVNKGLHFVKLDVGMKPDILAPGKGQPGSILKCPMSVAADTKTIVKSCSTASSGPAAANAKAGNKVVVTSGGDDDDKDKDF